MAFTDTASLPYLYLTIEGLGPTTDTGGTAVAYRLSTFDPGFAGFPAGTWRPYMSVLPSHVESELDPATCEVNNSAITFDLIEGSAGAVFLSDLFATRQRSRVGRLAARALAADATIDVTRVVGGVPAVNDVCWIGREALRITGVAAAGGVADPKTGVASDRLTVTRARYDTTAHIHDLGSNFGDDEVRYRPHYLRGREVTLRVNFQGDVEASAIVIWRGLLDGLELVTDGDAAGAAWRLRCRGVNGLLDTVIGHHLWIGRMQSIDELWSEQGLTVGAWIGASDDWSGGLPGAEQPMRPEPDSSNGGYVTIGDVLFDYNLDPARNPAAGASVLLELTVVNPADPGESALPEFKPVREVFPTGKTLTHAQFAPDPTGAAVARASDHPIDIFLCLALSTGDGSNVGAGQTSYDVLPSRIGAAIPVARFDILAWEAMRDRVMVRMPRLVIGEDGPFNLLGFATRELLGPCGIAPVEDEDGLIAPVRISEVSPADGVTAITEADVIPGSEVWDWSMDDQVSLSTWQFEGNAYSKEEFTLRFVTPAGRVRYPRSRDRTLSFAVHGMDPNDENARHAAEARQVWVARHFTEPPPRLTLALTWDNFRLALGSVVRLTHSSLPNPSTGTRGLVDEDFIVIGKRMAFEGLGQGGGGGVEVTLFWVGLDGTLGALWAPSAEVAAGDAGVGNPITVTENAFTDGEARGSVVADDTDGFLAGAATGDFVMLCDADLARRSANTPRITGKTATTLTLSDVFRDGGGVEIARAVGDLIIFVSDTGGVAPTVAWTAHMQESGAFADATNETIGTLARANHYLD